MLNKSVIDEGRILNLLSDTQKLTQALESGVRVALKKHKQAGNPVCEWRDGQVVWVQPEDIPDFDDK